MSLSLSSLTQDWVITENVPNPHVCNDSMCLLVNNLCWNWITILAAGFWKGEKRTIIQKMERKSSWKMRWSSWRMLSLPHYLFEGFGKTQRMFSKAGFWKWSSLSLPRHTFEKQLYLQKNDFFLKFCRIKCRGKKWSIMQRVKNARRWGEREWKEDRSNQINHYLLSITSQVFELKYLFVRFFQPQAEPSTRETRWWLWHFIFSFFFFFPLLTFNFSFQTTDKNRPRNVFFKDTPNKKIESRVARKERSLQV